MSEPKFKVGGLVLVMQNLTKWGKIHRVVEETISGGFSYDVLVSGLLEHYAECELTQVPPSRMAAEVTQYTTADQLNLMDKVTQQPHYTQFVIQPITFITANKLSYSQGNVIKYVCRYKGKNGKEDLLKARNYIDYLIQELETGEVKP